MKDNCAVCIHHNVFWGGSGCNLLNNNEKCKFEITKLHEQAKGIERAILGEVLELFGGVDT